MLPIRNVHRTVGAMLSGEIARKVRFGVACRTARFIRKVHRLGRTEFQRALFLAKGVSLELEGDANDYVGKGLSGGKHCGLSVT